jgi:endonuclease I
MRNFTELLIIAVACSSLLCADYYDGTEGLTGEELKSALHEIIKDHTQFSYDAVEEILINTDEDPNNPDNVILLYTGISIPKSEFGGMEDDWNREHVWAKSHGDFGTAPGPGTDVHHIRPANVWVNSCRGNKDFDNGGSPVYYNSYLAGWSDADSWEPRDEVKGDVARMILYMAVRYEGNDGELDLEVVDDIPSAPNNEPYHAKLSTLLEWHIEDPVDEWEQSRNNKIYEFWQHNRNPFIDHPEFADLIWNDNSIEDYETDCILLYSSPNPFSTSTTISFNIHHKDEKSAEIKIYNIKGQLVRQFNPPAGGLEFKINEVVWDGKDQTGRQVPSGIYFYKLNIGEKSVVRKMILLK